MGINAREAMIIGSIADEEFKAKGGYTQESRDSLLEAFNIAGKAFIDLAGELLDDTDLTLDWVNFQKITELNSVIQLVETARQTFIFNAVMKNGGKMMLEDIRENLLK